MKKLLTCATILAATVLSSTAADAALCGKRRDVIAAVTKDATLVGAGVVEETNLMEIYVSSEGDWTLIYSKGEASCIYGMGTDFQWNVTKLIKGENS